MRKVQEYRTVIQLPSTGKFNSSAPEVRKDYTVRVNGMGEGPLLKARLNIGRDVSRIRERGDGYRGRVVVDVAGPTDAEDKSVYHVYAKQDSPRSWTWLM